MRSAPKYVHLLNALLIFACVFGPMHVIADDAAHMHERIAHRVDFRVISDGASAPHVHHHHAHGDHHHADNAHDDALVHDHKPNHNKDHRHFLSEHEIVSTRTILAKSFDVAVLAGISLTEVQVAVSRILPRSDSAIRLFSNLPPPLRGPPSFQEFTSSR